MTGFNDVAPNSQMTVEEADLAIQKFYGQIRAAQGNSKTDIAIEMVTSEALAVLTKEAPWQAANLLHAMLEFIQPRDLERDSHDAIETKLMTYVLPRLDMIYPIAAEWYFEELKKWGSDPYVPFENGQRANKHPLRVDWQNFRTPLVKGIRDKSDEDKKAIALQLATSLILAKIAQEMPWAVLDVLSVIVENHPVAGREEFAQKYFFKSKALETVRGQCPGMAEAFEAKVQGFLPKPQVGAAPSGPAPTGG